MDARLFLIVFICIAALGLVLGIAIGFNLSGRPEVRRRPCDRTR